MYTNTLEAIANNTHLVITGLTELKSSDLWIDGDINQSVYCCKDIGILNTWYNVGLSVTGYLRVSRRD